MGVLRSAAHRRAESRFWGVFIIAVHRAFVLGLGARHRGIAELSGDRCIDVCETVFAFFTYLLTGDQVLGKTPVSRGTEKCRVLIRTSMGLSRVTAIRTLP